ncbi:sensor histidine kinase [Pelagibacterium sp. 26DY04]|uniref:sensor histidine kinase n=1 Tax=Pelagibacterium sp. 26DY04 TaxID=2967130 RepID=UPI0028163926|nr:sensor histidine kinase [Pelagibacterium sp. 26DY04]WMT87115.1 sensor histidine kinase [Pelagibacterium sp. 26DY04]
MSQSALENDTDKAVSEPGQAPIRPPRSVPIIFYLAFLVVVIVLPATAFTAVLLARHNVAQEETVETFTVATTRSVVQAVEREISGMITTQRVLMSIEALSDGDLAQFHEHARTALSGTGSFFILADENFNQLLNTRVEFGTPLGPISEIETARRALETPDAVVSNVFYGQTAENYVFNVVRQRPEITPPQLAILTQDAASLTNALLTRELPQGWHVALVDSNNTVLVASQDSARMGEPFFIPLSENSGSGTGWRDISIAGEDYRAITQYSILTGWYVVAWAPTSVVTEPLRTTLLWLLLGAILIVGLAAAAAAVVARQIASSVRGLARQARAMGAGEEIGPIPYPVHELAVVSQALADASDRRRQAETEARFLMREVAHRSKNQLTVIAAMAKQTARGADSVEKFVESFNNRLYGLARSTDLLLAHGTQGIGLRDLFGTQIDPFRPEDSSRVTKTGVNVYLNVQAAQVLGMAAHELATNAAKYGAFSREGGKLTINWNRAGGGRLHLVWRETVPDFTPPPERKGFGSVVLETMVASALKADVERIVHPDGIEWVFSIPLDQIDPDRDAPTPDELKPER